MGMLGKASRVAPADRAPSDQVDPRRSRFPLPLWDVTGGIVSVGCEVSGLALNMPDPALRWVQGPIKRNQSIDQRWLFIVVFTEFSPVSARVMIWSMGSWESVRAQEGVRARRGPPGSHGPARPPSLSRGWLRKRKWPARGGVVRPMASKPMRAAPIPGDPFETDGMIALRVRRLIPIPFGRLVWSENALVVGLCRTIAARSSRSLAVYPYPRLGAGDHMMRSHPYWRSCSFFAAA